MNPLHYKRGCPWLRVNLIILIIILSVVSRVNAQDWDQVQIKTVKLTKNIYMLQGRGGNIGVITGEDGVMIIDSQFAPLAGKIKSAIEELSTETITYVINTHWHGDHSGGNEIYGGEGSIIVAHENVRSRLSTDQFMEFQKEKITASPQEALPIITFTENMTFYFNNEEIWIHYGSAGHTDGDVVVYFKDSNVIHMGDSYVTFRYPFIDFSSGGSVNGYIENLRQILTMINDQTKVIPGHGDTSSKNDILNFRNALVDIRDNVKEQIDNGNSLDEILSSEYAGKYDKDWDDGFIQRKDFLTFVYSELTE